MQFCTVNYFIFCLKRNNKRERTIFRREFVFCKVSSESSLKNGTGIASHQFRGIKQLNTENKQLNSKLS